MIAANRGQVWTKASKVKHGQNPSIVSLCATYVCLHIIIMCMSHFLGILGPFLYEPNVHHGHSCMNPKTAFLMYVLRIAYIMNYLTFIKAAWHKNQRKFDICICIKF